MLDGIIGARGEAEVNKMTRKPNSQNPPCPRCGATHVIQKGQQGRAASLGLPELRVLLWPHPGHGDVSFACHPYGSGAPPAGGDAPGEPERRRGDHGPQI